MDAVAVFAQRERPVTAGQLRRLYDDVGWWPERTERDLAAMLEGTATVGAFHGDELVGFARAITDGRFRAYIEDVAVLSPDRGRGIGTRLVSRLRNEVADGDLTSLFCAPALTGFYERLGFRPTTQVAVHRAPGRHRPPHDETS